MHVALDKEIELNKSKQYGIIVVYRCL